jgi:hypothetical protein
MRIEIVNIEIKIDETIIEVNNHRSIEERKISYIVYYMAFIDCIPIKGQISLDEKLTLNQIKEKIKEDILIME